MMVTPEILAPLLIVLLVIGLILLANGWLGVPVLAEPRCA